MKDLLVVVEEVKGFCDMPMKPGDHFELRGGRLIIPPGKYMCIWALQSLIPLLPVKQRDIAEENDWIQDTSRVCCPDPNGMVIFRIDRVQAGGNEAEALSGIGVQGESRLAHAAETEVAETKPQSVSIGHMVVDSSVCSGCCACEVICSFTHEGVINPALSRVQVFKDEPTGKDLPMVCRQCGNARCVQACPKKALSRHKINRAVLAEPSLCNGCGLCAEACPFKIVKMHPETRLPLLCDLCGGDPQCVPRCVTGALWYGEAGKRPKRKVIGPQRKEAVDA